MLLLRKPTTATIQAFLEHQRPLDFTYRDKQRTEDQHSPTSDVRHRDVTIVAIAILDRLQSQSIWETSG
jgi:hypothetical protein